MKKDIMNTSRKESNLIKRLSKDERDRYVKQSIASLNCEMLFPFIQIVKQDKHFREIEYVIDLESTELDEIAELESAHKMMLARNKRLEKENAKLMQLNTNLWNKNENYVAVLRWIVNVGTDPQSVSKAREILRRYGREENQS